jgi:hypothetical protein
MMPKYLDHHKVVPPPQMVEETRKAIRAGVVGPGGVKGINGFIAKGESWCLTEAPNAAAVHAYHEAIGIKMATGDVVEVTALV